MNGVQDIFDATVDTANGITHEKKQHIGADGLLVCDKCGEPTECRVTVFGSDRKVNCVCRCDREKIEAEKREMEEEERRRRISRLRASGFDRTEMQRWTFDADDGSDVETMLRAKAYVNGFDGFMNDGAGLLFFGSVGTGKTYAAACIANALIDKGVPVLMTNFAQIINRLQESFDGRSEYLDSFREFDLLIIDDLAAERQTEYVNEIIFTVIDSRYRSGLPMIITTNITPRDMEREKNLARQRIYSRILERCHPIQVNGCDRRTKSLRGRFDEMEKLLCESKPRQFSQSSIDLSEAESLINKF